MVYIKLFIDYLDAIEPLGDAERGRLFTALMEYAKTGEVPQLNGNERFIFPMMKAQLDRDIAANEETAERNRANGLKGGRPKKPTETQKTQVVFEKPTETHNKDKDKDKDKDYDEDKDEYIPPKSPQGERKRFSPPSYQEVEAYCRSRHNSVDPQRFIDYYTSNGWKVGKNPMKDWQAAVRTWEKTTKQSSGREALEELWAEYKAEGSAGMGELPEWIDRP